MEGMHRLRGADSDSGLLSLAHVARFYRVRVSLEHLQKHYGHHNRPCSRDDILRAARAYHFRARKAFLALHQLHRSSLPAIVRDNHGEFFVLLALPDNRVATGRLCRIVTSSGLTETLYITELASLWSGELVLLKPPFVREPPGRGVALIPSLKGLLTVLSVPGERAAAQQRDESR